MSYSLEKLVALTRQPSRLSDPDDAIWEAFWRLYPRFRFVKTLAADTRLLDIGAGSGGLMHWREWLPPSRRDIKFYGVDMFRGEFADKYEDWRVTNLDDGLPQFNVPFDGFLASHLIEHIKSPGDLFTAMRRQAAPGARVYLEWPHPKTKNFPKVGELAAHGFSIQTLNFFDDCTHLATPERADVLTLLHDAGFEEVESGETSLGLLAEEVMIRGRRKNDMTWRQMGLWSATGWSNYVIARARS